METIKDLWASALAYVNERTTNPLTSAFVVSWAIWNYKFFVLLFSDESPSTTFAAIDAMYPRPDIYWAGGLAYPLATALVYVFLYPFLTERVVKFYRKRQVSIANTLKAVEQQRVRTVEEVTRMVRFHEKELSSVTDEVNQGRETIDGLRGALKKAEEDLIAERLKVIATPAALSNPPLLEKFLQKGEASQPDNATVAVAGLSGSELQEKNGAGPNPEGPYSSRQLRILTLLTSHPYLQRDQISSALDIQPYWADEDLLSLESSGAVQKTNSGSFKLSTSGRDVLRTAIANGQWTIAEKAR
jgi:hypothetical protein